MLKNSQGKIFYGMHFYPGVAEYQEPGKDPYRVFLNEDTIRSMDPTFAGRPIFVEHVDEVDSNLDELRKEADGWVMESFFNAADGKHWVKFIVVSEKGERAIKSGLKLSNAYVPKSFSNGGLWNGVSYQKEITSGEFEHLAIVKNPRYEESVILTPEQFKKYNEDKLVELKRLSNSKDQGEKKMKLSLFKKAKVENAADIEGISVLLPKSGREMTIEQIVNEMDMIEDAKKKNEVMADPSHKVKMHDGSMMNVGELMEKHKAMCDALEAAKKPKEDELEPEGELEVEPAAVDVESSPEMANADEEKPAADEEADKKKKEDEDKKKNELEAAAAKKAAAKAKADALKNAHLTDAHQPVAVVETSGDQVARGISRYGSN